MLAVAAHKSAPTAGQGEAVWRLLCGIISWERSGTLLATRPSAKGEVRPMGRQAWRLTMTIFNGHSVIFDFGYRYIVDWCISGAFPCAFCSW